MKFILNLETQSHPEGLEEIRTS